MLGGGGGALLIKEGPTLLVLYRFEVSTCLFGTWSLMGSLTVSSCERLTGNRRTLSTRRASATPMTSSTCAPSLLMFEGLKFGA